ncbi:MAG: serine dehydratase beta chain, partial [Pseudomonadota bacterium]
MLSVLDVFKIGVGPSSSHTLGPMKIGRRFLEEAKTAGAFDQAEEVYADLYGSLALTGVGHATDRATILGLLGEDARTIDTSQVPNMLAKIESSGKLSLLGEKDIPFTEKTHIRFMPPGEVPDAHPNGMR